MNTERTILTNMCMVYEGDKILVIDRNKSDWPGITFPGGKVESGEPFTESVIREVKEETNLDIVSPKLTGVKDFLLSDGTRYIVFCYTANEFSGELKSSDEGEVFWIKREELLNYELADNFEYMYKLFTGEYSEMYFDIEDSCNYKMYWVDEVDSF